MTINGVFSFDSRSKLAVEHLPQYRFDASELRMFPLEVVQEATELID